MSRSGKNRSSPGEDWRASLREAAPYLGLGMQLAITMLLGTGGGYLLDQWLGTLPLLTLLGAAGGLALVIVQVRLVDNESGKGRKS